MSRTLAIRPGHAFVLKPARVAKALVTAVVLAAVVVGGLHALMYEQVSSPGFLMNGSFAGEWVIHPDERSEIAGFSHGRERLEIRLTEDVKLAHFTDHPDSLAMPEGILARGTVTWDGTTSPCEFLYADTDPVGFQIRYTTASTSLPFGAEGYGDKINLWIDALRITGAWSLRRASSDVLYVTFGPGHEGVRYVRA